MEVNTVTVMARLNARTKTTFLMAAPEDLRARACVEHMVSITYERMDDFLKDEASNPDQPNRDISFGKDEYVPPFYFGSIITNQQALLRVKIHQRLS